MPPVKIAKGMRDAYIRMHARTHAHERARKNARGVFFARARARAREPALLAFFFRRAARTPRRGRFDPSGGSERPGTFFSQLVVYKARDGRRVRPLHRPAERFCARRAVCGGTDPVARAHDLGQYASIRSVTVVP